MRDFMRDHSSLALNTATLGHNIDGAGMGWSSHQLIDACAARGYGGITFWRREIGADAVAIGNQVRAAGMQVAGLCRAPFLTGPLKLPDAGDIIDDFKSAIAMAHDLGAPVLTIVTGGVEPGGYMKDSLKRVGDLVGEVASAAQQAGVILALEPLHPMYGGDRSCLVTTRDALDICDRLNMPNVQIAIDIYHVWWDMDLPAQLRRAGKERIAGFHLCDWLADTRDIGADRGMMGDGVADLRGIRRVIEEVGYQGFCEVEIFSKLNWWRRPPEQVLDIVLDRFRTTC